METAPWEQTANSTDASYLVAEAMAVDDSVGSSGREQIMDKHESRSMQRGDGKGYRTSAAFEAFDEPEQLQRRSPHAAFNTRFHLSIRMKETNAPRYFRQEISSGSMCLKPPKHASMSALQSPSQHPQLQPMSRLRPSRRSNDRR